MRQHHLATRLWRQSSTIQESAVRGHVAHVHSTLPLLQLHHSMRPGDCSAFYPQSVGRFRPDRHLRPPLRQARRAFLHGGRHRREPQPGRPVVRPRPEDRSDLLLAEAPLAMNRRTLQEPCRFVQLRRIPNQNALARSRSHWTSETPVTSDNKSRSASVINIETWGFGTLNERDALPEPREVNRRSLRPLGVVGVHGADHQLVRPVRKVALHAPEARAGVEVDAQLPLLK
eukprot:CAMPEP_0177219274 /NCGR_PEP_ID=MMETSP0367-20130122/36266_1 /TAXON_ID=447022 ORGANISM="Scrippsiella hangoei-like, Strain SHHI-4" /NCGR_SAMPLE_ID=MMETSP0367 /ASSEMBLY_ACC=CAM_ASM_000362 /LENGTH=229 /DNA_ID=CAMNT_0018668971 /DNA_START=39 /DNA_END=726 /DNA_ORIENTATION=+